MLEEIIITVIKVSLHSDVTHDDIEVIEQRLQDTMEMVAYKKTRMSEDRNEDRDENRGGLLKRISFFVRSSTGFNGAFILDVC